MQLLQFRVEGEWWTWIDYDKFLNLVNKYYESDGNETFSSQVIFSLLSTFV